MRLIVKIFKWVLDKAWANRTVRGFIQRKITASFEIGTQKMKEDIMKEIRIIRAENHQIIFDLQNILDNEILKDLIHDKRK